MKVTLNIPATPEEEQGFNDYLKRHPRVSVEKPNYGAPGEPMTVREFENLLNESRRQAKAGELTSIEELRTRAANR